MFSATTRASKAIARMSTLTSRVGGTRTSVLRAGARRFLRSTAVSDNKMSCFQCEQTLANAGCHVKGVCGKSALVSGLQDLVTAQAMGVGYWATAARAQGAEVPHSVNEMTFRALFSTVTNVNFDEDRFVQLAAEMSEVSESVRQLAMDSGFQPPAEGVPGPASIQVAPHADAEALSAIGFGTFGVDARQAAVEDADAFAAYELALYGLRGVGAYGTHALELHEESADLFSEVHRVLSELAYGGKGKTMMDGVQLSLAVGEANLTAMKLLDAGHNEQFGAPEPTQINMSATEGKCLLVSGHDMRDLEAILKQTEGTGVNVYTHGEMMPAHTYPGLKKYKHLVGHYGGQWSLQHFDFRNFPGSIVMTTNCLMRPKPAYEERIFTTNEVGYHGTAHIADGDFTPAIKAALNQPGFKMTEEPQTTLAGFGREALIGATDAVIDAAKAGDLKRIVIIGGCDGTENARSYYTDLASELPDESLMMTLGCGKFRVINKKDYGVVPNTQIPRLLDVGQCNDTYSAIAVAAELSKKLGVPVTDLPLSIVLSWFEQKAVAVLLSLLHLGLKGIRIGPRPPAFITPGLLGALVDNYDLKLIGDYASDDVDSVMGVAPPAEEAQQEQARA